MIGRFTAQMRCWIQSWVALIGQASHPDGRIRLHAGAVEPIWRLGRRGALCNNRLGNRGKDNMANTLTADEIRAWQPYRLNDDGLTPIQRARQRVERANQWAPWQMLGRRFAIGCVALEITQRCNLDCSYCYLSESSEAFKDIPIEEVYRRIDMIHAHYGDNTDVQVTGGDPTLRQRDELIAIVRYIKQKRMRAALFTNGIKASRELLAELCAVGLEDVAFHVDLTQQREGYTTERALNALRAEYLERARGLGCSVIFNTTVSPENFHEVPDIARFFVAHADVVRFASFQIGADSGRGTSRARVAVNAETVRAALREGAGGALSFNAASSGHAECNSYAFGIVINGRLHDFLDDAKFAQSVLHASTGVTASRANKRQMLATILGYALRHPRLSFAALARLAKLGWRARSDLVAARGKVQKISFFVHNFMDADALDHERCEACSFMVMTPEGPLSMCVHNAKRDTYLLVPATVQRENKMLYFNPATGEFQAELPTKISVSLNRKNARGRAKAEIQKPALADLAREAAE